MIDDLKRTFGKAHEKGSVAYMYFDYKEPKQQTFDAVVRSLLVQLLCLLRSIPGHLELVFDKSESATTERPPSRATPVLGGQSLKDLIFDALDERTENFLKQVISLIHCCDK